MNRNKLLQHMIGLILILLFLAGGCVPAATPTPDRVAAGVAEAKAIAATLTAEAPTPIPTATATDTPVPTATPTAIVTDTPVPTARPTSTPVPPTATPIPPTATPTSVELRIAFVSRHDRNRDEIYLINADGSDLTRLTDDPASDSLPAWSPDGRQMAFSSDRNGNSNIYVINADGSDLI